MTQTCIFSGAPPVERTEPALPLGSRTYIEYFEPHWYAAYTFANHEKGVAQQLERRSVECFLPLYESVRRWKDRRVRLCPPFFPGYVFVASRCAIGYEHCKSPALQNWLVSTATRLPCQTKTSKQ